MTTIPVEGESPSPVGIVTAVISLLANLFGLGASSEPVAMQHDLDTLGQNESSFMDQITKFATKLARTLGKLLTALQAVWTWLQAHVLALLKAIKKRLDWIEKNILKPYQDMMRRIRAQIMWIYKTFFRPIIQFIQSIRRVLSIFKLLGFKWAKKLDARLARLEGRIMAPILALLRHTNITGSWINYLVTLDGTLQRVVFVRSLWAYQGDVVNTFWGAQSFNPPATLPAAPAQLSLDQTGQDAAQALKDFLQATSGPYAASIQDAMQSIKAQPAV
jgi:hypothetical protein